MPARKRKKNSRQHGSTTHGWGARKKHRGSGNRGGQGMAGTGKRSDGKKPSIWKERYFGKFGFKKKGILVEINPINIEMIDANAEKWLKEKKINREGDVLVIDLATLGYNKLLGSGATSKKLKIITDYASKNAIKKLKQSGCELVIKQKKE
jgi:large subunit ribosomal protein L15